MMYTAARRPYARAGAAVMLAAALSFAVFCRLGTLMSFPEGVSLAFRSPFSGGIAAGCVRLCLADMLSFFLISICTCPGQSVAAAAAVFSLRGAVMGASCVFCIQNIASCRALSVLTSYGAVSLLTAVYCVMLSASDRMRPAVRLICYFTVCGAAALLRIIPYICLYA